MRILSVIALISVLLITIYPVYGGEVFYEVNDDTGDVSVSTLKPELRGYADRMDIKTAKVYIEGEYLRFELEFTGEPITVDEAIELMKKNYYYEVEYKIQLMVGDKLSKLSFVTVYGSTEGPEGVIDFMSAVFLGNDIATMEPIIVPLDLDISIVGNRMYVDVPLGAFGGASLSMPPPEDVKLYARVTMTVDIGGYIEDIVELWPTTEADRVDERPPVGDEAAGEEPGADIGEGDALETGIDIPYEWIVIGVIIVIVILVPLKSMIFK